MNYISIKPVFKALGTIGKINCLYPNICLFVLILFANIYQYFPSWYDFTDLGEASVCPKYLLPLPLPYSCLTSLWNSTSLTSYLLV